MTDPEIETWDPPQDTGAPDAAETDPAALNSAEDLDEDELRTDPLEAGMDPSERWSGADKYGTTPREEREPRPLDERLAEEEPDVPTPVPDGRPAESAAMSVRGDEVEIPPGPDDYEEALGIEADTDGRSAGGAGRAPEPPD